MIAETMPTCNETPIHIRSIGTRWFWVDNAVYDQYAPQIGIEGFGLYAALARHASNKTAECWPSMTTLATKFGTDLYTMEWALEKLLTAGLIHVRYQPGKGMVITLLDVATAQPVQPRPVAGPDAEAVAPVPATSLQEVSRARE